MLRIFSSYHFNPHILNPLRGVLENQVDFDFAALRKRCPIHLYVCAANFEMGKMGILTGENQSEDALLASACVPTLFRAVIINGEHHWDGDYMDNPVIYPLIYTANSGLSPTVHRLRAFGLLQQSG